MVRTIAAAAMALLLCSACGESTNSNDATSSAATAAPPPIAQQAPASSLLAAPNPPQSIAQSTAQASTSEGTNEEDCRVKAQVLRQVAEYRQQGISEAALLMNFKKTLGSDSPAYGGAQALVRLVYHGLFSDLSPEQAEKSMRASCLALTKN
ncbi:hypothetical protein [Burkholderia sp. Bp8991]|uniref:hypothetical protein n=1 Tax=Burkholderia sp. Bp8991 TaxID=2184553 RepID=UPI000F5A0B5C|nr:hypothetical protein [Burkholderia sp. Bp8991]